MNHYSYYPANKQMRYKLFISPETNHSIEKQALLFSGFDGVTNELLDSVRSLTAKLMAIVLWRNFSPIGNFFRLFV